MNRSIANDTIFIRRIKHISFSINEQNVDPDTDKTIKIEIGQNLTFEFELNYINLSIKILYYYPEKGAQKELAHTEVQNIYEIPNLIQYKTDEHQIKLPQETITTIVGLSITHTRSLLAAQLSGTVLQETIMQIVNPSEVARHFYPTMFEEKGNE